MKKPILSEQFLRMQKIAGILNENEGLNSIGGLKLISRDVIDEKIRKYWDDENREIVDQTILNKYVYSGYEVELIEWIFYFIDDREIAHYKTIVKIFKDGNLVSRKLFWMGYDKWNGLEHEDLIKITLDKK
jgi:hypothetical protein